LRAFNENIQIVAFREEIVFPTSFSLIAAETTIVGRRAQTEAAIAEEGGTQLAAARDRCSS
jgi:hypothetical protein